MFSKKGKGDTIDFTYLQKRGLLPPPKHKYTTRLPTTSDGIVDFRNMPGSKEDDTAKSPSEAGSAPAGDSGAFGFLANMAASAESAQASSQTQSFSVGESSDISEDPIRAARRARLAEFNSMKVKIEDLEYKLERSLERIAQLESQIAEIRK